MSFLKAALLGSGLILSFPLTMVKGFFLFVLVLFFFFLIKVNNQTFGGNGCEGVFYIL